MKMVIAFVLGVMVGAVTTLLLAPKSGEELRQELRQEAIAERERQERNTPKLWNRCSSVWIKFKVICRKCWHR